MLEVPLAAQHQQWHPMKHGSLPGNSWHQQVWAGVATSLERQLLVLALTRCEPSPKVQVDVLAAARAATARIAVPFHLKWPAPLGL